VPPRSSCGNKWSFKYCSLLEGWPIRDHISIRFSFSNMLRHSAPSWDEGWYGLLKYAIHTWIGLFESVFTFWPIRKLTRLLSKTVHDRGRRGVNDVIGLLLGAEIRGKTTTLPRSRACLPSWFLWLLDFVADLTMKFTLSKCRECSLLNCCSKVGHLLYLESSRPRILVVKQR